MITPFLEHGIFLVALISGVPLLISTGVSLTVAILQAATQIQEQSIGFLLKVGTVATVLMLAGHRIAGLLIEYFQWTFDAIRFIGG
jgi:flagellar biosynthetic protein FliQ